MKIKSLLTVLLISVFIYGCDEDDEDIIKSVINNIEGSYVSASLDGQNFNATTVFGSLDSNFVLLGGLSASDYPQMIISIHKDAVPTTYTYPIDFFNDSTSAGIIYSTNDSTTYLFNNGQLVLSEHDMVNRTVQGTFQGTMYEFSLAPDADSIVVTNGRFRGSY